MKWKTRNGVEKDIKKLETPHLKNILKLLYKRNGAVKLSGGLDGDDEPWYDEEVIDHSESIEKIELELRLRKIEEALKITKEGGNETKKMS